MVMIYIKAIRSGVCVCVCHKNTSLSAKDYVWEVSNDCHWPKLKMDHLLAVNISQEELDDATKEMEGASLGGGCIYGRRQRAVWGLVVIMIMLMMVMMLLKFTVVVWSCRYEATWSSWLPIKSHFGANLQTFTHFKLFKLELCQMSKSKWETRIWSGDNAKTAF